MKNPKSNIQFDRRIFAADIRVSIAYCDELFGVGIFTRLESERVKNALQSILKRADYDKNYFDELASKNNFYLLQLIKSLFSIFITFV